MKKKILIIGTGDHARVAAEVFRAGGLTVEGFVVPEENESPGSLDSLPLLSWEEAASRQNNVWFHVGIGRNSKRRQITEKAGAAGFEIVSAVHPQAVAGGGATIGEGSIVSASAVLVVNVSLGRGTIINTAASIDHDCVIGNWCHVAPGAVLAGRVTLGDGVFIGAGAVVVQNVTIGGKTVVGAGAVVLEDLPPSVTAAGVPARLVGKETEPL